MKLKLLVALVVILILAFTVFGEHGLINLVRFQKQADVMVMETARLKKQNQALLREVELLKYDATYIERLAREELGMVKPGELVIKFSGSGPDWRSQ